jgi:hypothetical protein
MKVITSITAPASADLLNGALRRYKNKNTGAWFFGFIAAKWDPSGLRSVWTNDEAKALADHGEVASMLALGTGQSVSTAMLNESGGSGSGATVWDAILDQVAGGDHASGVLCKRGQTRKGGFVAVVRGDGATVEEQQ